MSDNKRLIRFYISIQLLANDIKENNPGTFLALNKIIEAIRKKDGFFSINHILKLMKGTPSLFNLQGDEVQLLKAKSKNSELIKLGGNVEELKREGHAGITHPTEYGLSASKKSFYLVDINGKLLPTQQKHVFAALIMNYPSGVLRIVFEGKKIVCSKERKAKFNIRLGVTEQNDVYAIITGVDGQSTDDNGGTPNIQSLQERHNFVTSLMDNYNAFNIKSDCETDEDLDEGIDSWAEQVENFHENQVNEKMSKTGLQVNPSELHQNEGAKPKAKKCKAVEKSRDVNVEAFLKHTKSKSSDLKKTNGEPYETRNDTDLDRRSSVSSTSLMSSTNFSAIAVKLKPANLNGDLAMKEVKPQGQGIKCDIDDRRSSIQSMGTSSIRADYAKFDNDSISETSSQLSEMKMSGWKTSSGGQMKVEHKKFQIIDWLEDKQSSTIDRTQEIQEVEVVVRAKICLQPGEQLMAINNFDASLMILNKNK